MTTLNSLLRYFDLVSDLRPKGPVGMSEGKKLPPVLPQYIAVAFGVLIQPYFSAFQETGMFVWTGFTARVLFAAIASLAILPGIYKNSFDRDKPIFIQLCLLFVAGMGWQSLLATAITAAPSP
jgi:hypothetical protein